MTMKAITFARYGGPEVLEYVDAPLPSPGPGEVLVRQHAASINAADYRTPGRFPYVRVTVDF